jgi:hypothetical protein
MKNEKKNKTKQKKFEKLFFLVQQKKPIKCANKYTNIPT